ncbi:MAG: LysE family transporter [Anaerolineae bacterium]|jgi:threonine/homoserine/homoserine lactone efflux protein
MPLLAFLLDAVLISLSGVMAPGPITAVTVGKGSESPHAGAWIAIGHGVVEFPLMVSIFYGVGYLLDQLHVKAAIACVGGLFLLFMSIDMFRNIKQADVSSRKYARSPLVAGMVLSLANPYFIVWWATVGATLILRSVSFGALGFLAFALLHWLCDFLWGYFLSALSFRGGRFFGKRFQQVVFAACGVLLLYFSGKFIIDGARAFFA